MKGLQGKVIVIAGGGSGIGAATARRLAEEGASVVIGDIAGAAAETVAAQIRDQGGNALGVAFDIGDDASVKNLIDTAVQTYGGLDGLHANAADLSVIFEDGDALDVSLAVFDHPIITPY